MTQILRGETNQTRSENVYCLLNGIRYPSTITDGEYEIIIPRHVMQGLPVNQKFRVIIKNDTGDTLVLERTARLNQPAEPTAVEAIVKGPGALRVKWQPPATRGRIIGYQVLLNGKQVFHGSELYYDMAGLRIGTTQMIQIRSFDDIRQYSMPVTIRKAISPSLAPRIRSNLSSNVTVNSPSLLVNWEDTQPRQWEVVVRAWQANRHKLILNEKVPRGTNSITITGYITDQPLNITLINVPEKAAGGGPDYKNVERHGTQTFSMSVSL